MNITQIKGKIESKLSVIVFMLLVLQPILDVFSFFLSKDNPSAITTLLRFVLLFLVAFLGFLLSDNKKVYFIVYGILSVFWFLHVLNCFRIGYISFFSDTANFLRIVSLQIYTLSLITFFKKGKNIRKSICWGFTASFILVVVFTAIPWLIGRPEYTYDNIGVGISGWFSVKSAQSAIIGLLVPISILFAYKTKKYYLYIAALAATMALLFFSGTKLTFYCIFLICAGFTVLFAYNLKFKSIKYIVPLFLVVITVFVFKSKSPMYERNELIKISQGNYQLLVSDSVQGAQEDDSDESLRKKNIPYLRTEMKKKKIFGVYSDDAVYGTVYKDINYRFGLYNVMKVYDYTIDTSILSDSRDRKLFFARLVWNEKDFITKLLGYEYIEMVCANSNYDLENDFPAVFYFTGYLGFALYMSLFGYVFFAVVRAFWRNKKKFLTVEMGAILMTFVLALGAAQISGNVLRRPNVTIYFALVAAYLYHLTVNKLPPKLPKKQKAETTEDLN
jgi:hypothetical protein